MLVREGMTVTKSFGYSLVVFSAIPVGYYSGALAGLVGPEVDDCGVHAWGGLAAIPMIFVRKEGLILFFAFLLYVFMSGVYPPMYAYSSEVYPTNIRATGLGVASAFGRMERLLPPYSSAPPTPGLVSGEFSHCHGGPAGGSRRHCNPGNQYDGQDFGADHR